MARKFVVANSDYIDLGTSNTLNLSSAGTVSAWAYSTTGGTNFDSIYDRPNASSQHQFGLFLNGGVQWLFMGSSNINGGSVSSNTWYHTAGTFDGSNMTLYVNGAVVAGPTANAGASMSGFNSYIGQDNSQGGSFWPGNIADVGIWNVALTALEIAGLSKGTRPIATRPNALMGWWPLDGLASPEPDLSGNKNNGTVHGTSLAFGPPIVPFTPRWPRIEQPIFIPTMDFTMFIPVAMTIPVTIQIHS